MRFVGGSGCGRWGPTRITCFTLTTPLTLPRGSISWSMGHHHTLAAQREHTSFGRSICCNVGTSDVNILRVVGVDHPRAKDFAPSVRCCMLSVLSTVVIGRGGGQRKSVPRKCQPPLQTDRALWYPSPQFRQGFRWGDICPLLQGLHCTCLCRRCIGRCCQPTCCGATRSNAVQSSLDDRSSAPRKPKPPPTN